MKNKPTTLEHIKSVIQLPFMAAIFIPSVIYYLRKESSIIPIHEIPATINLIIGAFTLLLGIIIFWRSLDLFIKIGNGTLAPWNPTKQMIIQGPYQYVRNPMLIGVIFILVGEAFLLRSGNILVWMMIFVAINTIYFILKEEPDLRKKFGDEYADYCKHVPRWMPRSIPYQPK